MQALGKVLEDELEFVRPTTGEKGDQQTELRERLALAFRREKARYVFGAFHDIYALLHRYRNIGEPQEHCRRGERVPKILW